jgi:energy-coupling factor transporter ATP-binding protein EcfA2
MKKVKVIIGKRESGKSRIAKAMVSSIKDEEKVFIKANSFKGGFPFHNCTEQTKVVIIEDFRSSQDLLPLIFSVVDGLIVDRKHKKQILIFTEIIIECHEEITRDMLERMGSSIERRIEIIETIS